MNRLALARKLLLRDLFLVFVHVTYRCDSRCGACFIGEDAASAVGTELSTDEYRMIARGLGEFPWLLISGGEPSLRDDLPEIVDIFHRECGVLHATIPSNGLHADRLTGHLDAIVRSCPDLTVSVSLSLDGIGAEHDALRGVPGNFDATIRCFAALRDMARTRPRLTVKFNTVVSSRNYAGLGRLVDYVKGLSPDMHSLDLLRGVPRDRSFGPPPPEALPDVIAAMRDVTRHYGGYRSLGTRSTVLQRIQVRASLEYQRMLLSTLAKGQPPRYCNADRLSLVLSPYGDVSLCEMLPPLGNVRDHGYGTAFARRAGSMSRRIPAPGCPCYHPCNHLADMTLSPRTVAGALLDALLRRTR